MVDQWLAGESVQGRSTGRTLLFSGTPTTAATMYGLSVTDGLNSRHVRKFDVQAHSLNRCCSRYRDNRRGVVFTSANTARSDPQRWRTTNVGAWQSGE